MMKKIKLFGITLCDPKYPKEKKPEECIHRWLFAGPTKKRSKILDGIDGITYTVNDDDSKYPGRLYVKAEGNSVWKDGEIFDWPASRVYWRDSDIQGEVCVKCGECVDAIKKQEEFWKGKVIENRAFAQKKLEEQLLAEKMWHECPERSQ